MTVTCTHCGEIFTLVPIIGEQDAGFRDLLTRMFQHLAKNHSKPAHNSPQMMAARKGQPCDCAKCADDRVVANAQQKASIIAAALIGLAKFGQFTSTDEDYNKKAHQSFEDALRLVMEFEPKGAVIAG